MQMEHEIKTLATFFDENTTQIVDPDFRTVDAERPATLLIIYQSLLKN